MSQATLTPDAKALLAKTIRDLHARLLRDLRAAAESAYRLALPAKQAALDEAAGKKRERLEAWVDERARANDLRQAFGQTQPERVRELVAGEKKRRERKAGRVAEEGQGALEFGDAVETGDEAGDG